MAGSKLRDEVGHALETCLKEAGEGRMLVEGLKPGVPHGAVALGDDILMRDGRVFQRCLQLLPSDVGSQPTSLAECVTLIALCPATYRHQFRQKEVLKQHASDAPHEASDKELRGQSPHCQTALLAQVVCVQEHVDLLVGASRHIREEAITRRANAAAAANEGKAVQVLKPCTVEDKLPIPAETCFAYVLDHTMKKSSSFMARPGQTMSTNGLDR